MDLVPIKVKIKLKESGQAWYPNFNSMTSVQNSGMDWAQYIDAYGTGWHYDKTSGHKEETPESPRGQQWGMILVPKAFADEAVATFPNECSKLNETECQDFYDNKAHINDPEYEIDEEALKIFDIKDKYKIALTPEEETKKAKALDPNDDTPGIKKNKRKKWADYKIKEGINIVQ